MCYGRKKGGLKSAQNDSRRRARELPRQATQSRARMTTPPHLVLTKLVPRLTRPRRTPYSFPNSAPKNEHRMAWGKLPAPRPVGTRATRCRMNTDESSREQTSWAARRTAGTNKHVAQPRHNLNPIVSTLATVYIIRTFFQGTSSKLSNPDRGTPA